MKKTILMISFSILLLLIVSGCSRYPTNSPKIVVDQGQNVENPGSSKITGLGPVMCLEGITCQKPNGVQYSIPCDRQGSECHQRNCDSGDRWISGYCRPVPIDPDTGEIENT